MLRQVAQLVFRRKAHDVVGWSIGMQARTMKWSVEKEPAEYKSVTEIIDDSLITSMLDQTKEAAKDVSRIREILAAAKERSFLKDVQPGDVSSCALSLKKEGTGAVQRIDHCPSPMTKLINLIGL